MNKRLRVALLGDSHCDCPLVQVTPQRGTFLQARP